MHHMVQVGLLILVAILVLGGLCWVADRIAPPGFPRPVMFISITVAFILIGGYFQNAGYFG